MRSDSATLAFAATAQTSDSGDLPVVSRDFAERFGVILSGLSDSRLHATLRVGADPEILFRIQAYFGRAFDVGFADPDAFDRMLDRDHAGGAPTEAAGADAYAVPIAPQLLATSILTGAVDRQASDVHLEPRPGGVVVRLRIAGLLGDTLQLPRETGAALIAYLKQAAGLDPGSGGGPQSGGFRLPGGATAPSATIATLPSADGERVVIALGGDGDGSEGLARLGMSAGLIGMLRPSMLRAGGLVVVAGPRGSGRTTTLYALVRHLGGSTRNVLTVEEHIETALPGVGQIAVDPARGLSLAAGLRAVLRQDPDVVMLGRLDTAETAAAAAQAAQAGLLVLTSVEAEDAVGAIAALRQLKIDPFLLASSLRMVIAQRLARRLCTHCRRPVQAEGSVSSLLGFDPGAIVHVPTGCEACEGIGYSGRIGVFESIRVDAAIRRLIHNGGDASILTRHAFVNAPNLGAAARALVREGLTSPDEAVRVSRTGAAAILG